MILPEAEIHSFFILSIIFFSDNIYHLGPHIHHQMLVKAWETEVGILVDSDSRHGCGLSCFCESSALPLVLSYIFSEFLYLTSGGQKMSVISFWYQRGKILVSEKFLTSYDLIIGRENEGTRYFRAVLIKPTGGLQIRVFSPARGIGDPLLILL